MGTAFYYAKISSVNYGDGTASVTIPDREGQVIGSVPFTATVYEMAEPGDMVGVIFDESDGQLGRGLIIGKIWSSKQKPSQTGKGIFYKEFSDKSGIKYSPELKQLDVNVSKMMVDEIIYRKATKKE